MPTDSAGWKWVTAIAAVVTVGCGAFAVAAAVTSDDDGGGGTAQQPSGEPTEQVVIRDFAFVPPQLSVPAGSTVAWTNEDGTTHTVRDTKGAVIASSNLNQGDTYTATFEDPGTYDYICTIHTNMSGTVTVTE
jgi:plastocyanin